MKTVRKIKPFFVDKRGEMSFLLEDETSITSALLISSKKGSVRAEHYHKKDTHYAYLLEGKMEYSYKDMENKKSRKRKIIINKGELIFTPPMIAHAMKFPEDSVFIVLTTEKRNQKSYEKDTVHFIF